MNNTHFFTILSFLLFGGVLHFAFLILNNFLLPKQAKKIQNLIGERSQLLIWLIYAVLFYSYLVTNAPIISLSLTAIILAIGWQYWRNVFSGLLIKLQQNIKNGDYIETDTVKGQIMNIGLANTLLIGSDKTQVQVPNTELNNSILKQKDHLDTLKTHTFIIKPEGNDDAKQIKELAFSCPYFIQNKSISITTTKKGYFRVKAQLIALDLEERVLEYFENK